MGRNIFEAYLNRDSTLVKIFLLLDLEYVHFDVIINVFDNMVIDVCHELSHLRPVVAFAF